MVTTGIERRETGIDDTYDESLDPDYTLSNTVVVSDEDTDSEIEIDHDDEKKEQTTEKTVQIPYHNFHSFIHKHEVPRKFLHSLIGFITLYLHCKGFRTESVWEPTLKSCLIVGVLDLIRFRWDAFNRAYCVVVGFLMREKEIHQFNGIIWYQLGCIIALYFQKQDVAIMSVLLLSWSDTAASTVGRALGKYSPKIARGKSLVGSFAAFLVGVSSCYAFYGYIAPNYPQYNYDFEYNPNENALGLHTMALACGFIAALSEGIDLWNLDDNFTIPMFSSIFLRIVIDLGKVAA